MKINFTVRAKNPAFWVQVLLAVGTPVLAYFGLTGADLTSWPLLGSTVWQALCNPYVCALVAVSLYNALQDPTTPGVGDSARALTYTHPGE
jgi:phi LC3 family holin